MVNENPYRYLFPFEKIPIHSRIVIYGAGTLGQEYLRQMLLTQYCEVVAMVDKNYNQYPPMSVPVVSPETIHSLSFDYAVIAIRMEASFNEIKRILKRESVDEDRIICIFERKDTGNTVFREQTFAENKNESELAFSKSPISIAVLATGGYGDMVIQKRFITELICLAPECVIDFYNIKAIDFLRYLYANCRNVNQILPDLGNRYRENCHKYALGLTIEACHFIRVDSWNEEIAGTEKGGLPPAFIESIRKLKAETEAENADISTPAHLTMVRRLYQGLNAYSGFNYNGAFNIEDKKASIPLDKEWEPAFLKLGLGRYITVNFGNGDCADGSKVAKSWSRDCFERLVELFKRKYCDINVVQMGAKNSDQLKGVDRSVLGEDFRLVVHILKNSMLHVDIEGGLVHIATQLCTRCIVLFGPTVKEYYGYEQNINIQAGGCHNCWGLYSDVNKCARGMKEPECMYLITPELVMEQIEEHMKSVSHESRFMMKAALREM